MGPSRSRPDDDQNEEEVASQATDEVSPIPNQEEEPELTSTHPQLWQAYSAIEWDGAREELDIALAGPPPRERPNQQPAAENEARENIPGRSQHGGTNNLTTCYNPSSPQ